MSWGFYMYGLTFDDVRKMYKLKGENKDFRKELSIVANKLEPFGAQLNKVAPDQCKQISNLTRMNFMRTAENVRFQMLSEHQLITQAFIMEVKLVKLLKKWLPDISDKLMEQSQLWKRYGNDAIA